MGKFSPAKQHGDCEEIANPSTAYGDKKLSPELEGFIDRVLVPCLVKRYIRQLKEGKQPTWERDGVAAK
ncbi:MAG: hypothetical protein WB711_19640 [Terriglobales bacterium]